MNIGDKVRITEDCRPGGTATGKTGTYEGMFPAPDGFDNPRIRLEDGSVIWGAECWWGSADTPTTEAVEQTQNMKEIFSVLLFATAAKIVAEELHTASKTFPMGMVASTPGALDMLSEQNLNPKQFLARHATGDWGDVCESDKALNDEALKDGRRLVSNYTTANGDLLIITEADRSATTLLLPEDY